MTQAKVLLERRNQPRFSIALKADYEVISPNGKKQRSHTADLSAAGVRLYSAQPLNVGDKVKVSVHISKGHLIEAEGAVIWVRPTSGHETEMGYSHVFGFKFSRVSQEDSGFIAQYVQKCLLDR